MNKKTRSEAIVEAVNYAGGKWVCNAHHVTWGFKVTKKEFDTCVNDMKRALWIVDLPMDSCAKIYRNLLGLSSCFTAGFAAGIIVGVFLIAG